jgi:RNA polymerase sigma-32 factor
VATTKAQRKLFFNLRKAKKHLGWLNKAETEAVAKDLGVTEREVTEMEQRLSGYDVSFDPAPASEDDEYTPQAYLRSANSDPADAVEQADWENTAHDQLGEALDQLDGRSRDIVARRWLSDAKATLHELAAEYEVSAERIRQIESAAIGKLKGLMAA